MLQQNIKQFRKQKGYTQETLAQELNVVRQTVSKWEKGYSVPDALMLEKMADLFEVSVSDLLGTPETTEEKTDLKDIAEQLSILNNQFAKELARKRRNRRIVLLVLCLCPGRRDRYGHLRRTLAGAGQSRVRSDSVRPQHAGLSRGM